MRGWSGVVAQWQTFPRLGLPQPQKSADWHRPSPPLPTHYTTILLRRPGARSPSPPLPPPSAPCGARQPILAPTSDLSTLKPPGPSFAVLCCASGTEPRGFGQPLACPANPCRPFGASMPLCLRAIAELLVLKTPACPDVPSVLPRCRSSTWLDPPCRIKAAAPLSLREHHLFERSGSKGGYRMFGRSTVLASRANVTLDRLAQ
ncbi:hypothetical protein IWX49DRAFT_301721 [Phyllosticta citricarpa]|uniref:Uncharacterized protein n=1 Tax=Phyllosticta citricarpa TaxID=55181 RepID=A0ABR1LGR0_9PEZI